MAELGRRVLLLRRHVAVELDDRELERGLSRLETRIARRRAATRVALATASAALLLLGWITFAPDPQVIATRDGSVARMVDDDTRLSLTSERDDQVELELANGAGHFEVSRKPARRYRVRAGAVTVEVLGTVFDVKRSAEEVFVRVERGAVHVAWPGGMRVLHTGEESWFPPPPEAHSRVLPQAAQANEPPRAPIEKLENAAPQQATSAREQTRRRHSPRAERSDHGKEPWRALAREGKHGAAFASLGENKVDDLDGLLLAADAARFSGHPREAATHFERLIQRYPSDARSPLAAFTLGRLLLNELSRPREAAEAFARAYALDPRGELAEDALSREAEAYHRAGDGERARSAAERYLARYPKGARRRAVERYLELR